VVALYADTNSKIMTLLSVQCTIKMKQTKNFKTLGEKFVVNNITGVESNK